MFNEIAIFFKSAAGAIGAIVAFLGLLLVFVLNWQKYKLQKLQLEKLKKEQEGQKGEEPLVKISTPIESRDAKREYRSTQGNLRFMRIRLVLIGLVGGICCVGIFIGIEVPTPAPYPGPLPDECPVKAVSVPANVYWYDTGIRVKEGDCLSFSASGQWYNGISTTGPNGDPNQEAWACGNCPIVDGLLGLLIGRVGEKEKKNFFKIGKRSYISAAKTGRLFLCMNENTGPCKDGREGSCYEDNSGILNVCVQANRIEKGLKENLDDIFRNGNWFMYPDDKFYLIGVKVRIPVNSSTDSDAIVHLS